MTRLSGVLLPNGWEHYQYSPLDHELHSIRLLRILSRDTATGYLRCELHRTVMQSTYTCLSYVWGPAEPASWIIVSGKLLRVRKNLQRFLKQVLRTGTEREFWIDALCIDQDSVLERNHQVRLMGQIFSNAQEVIAWLGREKRISRFLRKPRHSGQDYYEFWSSEFWNRAWITQEVVLAKRLTLMAGSTALDVNVLRQYIDGSLPGSRFSVLSPEALSTFRNKSLFDILYKLSFHECERPSDRIFSLLALCREGPTIDVDYSWSPERLIGHVMVRCSASLCWCSVYILKIVLRLGSSPDIPWDAGLPFVQFTTCIKPRKGKPKSLPTVIDMMLESLCIHYYTTEFLRITPLMDEVAATVQLPGTEEGLVCGTCTFRLIGDGSLVKVHVPLSTMIKIPARQASFGGFAGPCPQSASEPSLYISDDMAGDIGTPATLSYYKR